MKYYNCMRSELAELKRINYKPMTLEEIRCSRCARYGTPERGCLYYTTLEHLESFDKMFDLKVSLGEIEWTKNYLNYKN